MIDDEDDDENQEKENYEEVVTERHFFDVTEKVEVVTIETDPLFKTDEIEKAGEDAFKKRTENGYFQESHGHYSHSR